MLQHFVISRASSLRTLVSWSLTPGHHRLAEKIRICVLLIWNKFIFFILQMLRFFSVFILFTVVFISVVIVINFQTKNCSINSSLLCRCSPQWRVDNFKPMTSKTGWEGNFFGPLWRKKNILCKYFRLLLEREHKETMRKTQTETDFFLSSFILRLTLIPLWQNLNKPQYCIYFEVRLQASRWY